MQPTRITAAAIQAEIDALTLEWIELCAHYKTPESYLIPDTPTRMKALQELLNGADGRGGLWAKWRSAIALEAAGGKATCQGPTEAGKKRGERGTI